jgi:glycosyltransferase involved in cell wall biosynthesis
MNWSLVVASNSEEILRGNLLHSSEVNSAKEILIQRNPINASSAYNEGLAKSTGDVVVFAHQDVYLPPGWDAQLRKNILQLTKKDPQWGVAGLYGMTHAGQDVGYVYSTGLKRFIGEPFEKPITVSNLDEMLLIIRRDSQLHFDESLQGFHLYGVDICLEAETMGMNNYIIPCFAVHNSNGIKWLPFGFWRAYIYMQNKWKCRLPIATTCTTITQGYYAMLNYVFRKAILTIIRKNGAGNRVSNPEAFYFASVYPAINRNVDHE